jgi:hypothetical protein
MFRIELEMILIGAILFGLVLFFAADDGAYIPEPGEVIVFEEDPEPDPAPEPEPADEPVPDPPAPSGFSYYDVGNLLDGSGSGIGDGEIYAPGIVFPIDNAEAFLNSQYFNPGGAGGPAGGQCDSANYSYPWRDTFCETRWSDRNTRNCPKDQVHRGVDIRAGDPDLCSTLRSVPSADHKSVIIVAPEDGYISYIGNYSFNLRAGGRLYTFIHVNMSELMFEELDDVSAGQSLAYLSNYYTAPTTLHLHLNLQANLNEEGFVHVSPYMSLVRSYEAKLGEEGIVVSD